MFIVMHIGGMPFRGSDGRQQPGGLGGSETSALELAEALAARGHTLMVFTNIREEDEEVHHGVRYLAAGRPSEQAPLGERFDFFARQTPHDVLVVQRTPVGVIGRYAAKRVVLWLHDLALVRSRRAAQEAQAWVSQVWAPSDWHRRQVLETWELAPDLVRVVPNPVALPDPMETAPPPTCYPEPPEEPLLVYASRPERGLKELVAENGVMERLQEHGVPGHLVVVGYDNTTDKMRGYYEALWDRCRELPNVTLLGPLNKRDLHALLRRTAALVYPTGFEETFCIVMAEALRCGAQVIGSQTGAPPELYGRVEAATFLKGSSENQRVARFVQQVRKLGRREDTALPAEDPVPWCAPDAVAETVEELLLTGLLDGRGYRPATVARHLLRHSDIMMLRWYLRDHADDEDPLLDTVREELRLYEFTDEPLAEHYRGRYQTLVEQGRAPGRVDLTGNLRYQTVERCLREWLARQEEQNVVVLDYGCGQGHHTVHLARAFPEVRFIGHDVVPGLLETGRRWAEEEGLGNVRFVDNLQDLQDGEAPHAVLAAEVLEHVPDPVRLLDDLNSLCRSGGLLLLTTPYGPVEAETYEEEYPHREHLHHFERADLHELLSEFGGVRLLAVHWRMGAQGDPLGSYVVRATANPDRRACPVDYARKLRELGPRETVGGLMLLKDCTASLERAVRSLAPVVDQLVLQVDATSDEATYELADDLAHELRRTGRDVYVRRGPSALEVGFDEARNRALEDITADWVLWLDTDEQLYYPDHVFSYLHPSGINGLAVPQHHMSVEPLGVLKTDLPVRLFRHHHGVRFFGVVHEHPERELNAGVTPVVHIRETQIIHHGYDLEATRRGRFQRNLELLVRDREKYPSRRLGKFLWLRDLAQMCQYELEHNGGHVTRAMRERADDGVALWEELLEAGQTRMAIDALPFYSTLVKVLDRGFDAAFKLSASKLNGGPRLERAPEIAGTFLSEDHLRRLHGAVLHERVQDYEQAYF